MRIWLHTSAKGFSIGGSSAISVAAHAVLIGAAVYGTGVRARRLEEAIANRVSALRYLPPPDRHPSSENYQEHLQFAEIGGRRTELVERADGQVAVRPGVDASKSPTGERGEETRSLAPMEKLNSPDSVYSLLEVEEAATRTAGSAAPAYPGDLVKDGTEGSVYLRFVVDSSGRADVGSIEVIRSTHPAFTQAVRSALPLMMFTPAAVGGRHVRQLVEQNFQFRLTRPAPAEQTRTQSGP